MTFLEVLTLIFVVLKLTKTIAWSWLWVLSPLWIPFALGLVVIISYLAFMLICNVITKLGF